MYFYGIVILILLASLGLASTIKQNDATGKPPSTTFIVKSVGKILLCAGVFLAAINFMNNSGKSNARSGVAAYNQSHFTEAETDMQRSLSFYPWNVTARYYRGLCLLREGKKEAAINDFRSVCFQVDGGRYRTSNERQLSQEAHAQREQLGDGP